MARIYSPLPSNTYIQPPDSFLDLERCVLSRPDFIAPRCFAGSTAIDFFLLRGPAGLRLRVEGLRCRSLGTGRLVSWRALDLLAPPCMPFGVLSCHALTKEL